VDRAPERPVGKIIDTLGPPATPDATQRDGANSRRVPTRRCQGCGGAKYNPQDFNRPGGPDELIQQLG